MALIAASEAHDHLPEHGTLTVRDAEGAEPAAGEERLGLWATDVQPCGTFVRAGIGWLEGAAGDGPLVVRLQRHDSRPPEDTWDDVAETPYRTTDGQVILTSLDGGATYAALDLAGPGHHRIRVTRNRGEYGADTWRLQFWPVAAPEPPRWFARSRPAVLRGSSGWGRVLGRVVPEVWGTVRSAATGPDGVTAEHLPGWDSEAPDWLDEPLWIDPATYLPTGHPERDEVIRRQIPATRERHAQEQEHLADLAGQLGVTVPRSRREILPLLVAAGLLTVDDHDRYREVVPLPRAQDVLELPAEQVRDIEATDDMNAHRSAVSDVVAVVLWAGGPRYPTTVPDLANRLLMPPEDLRSTLRYAQRAGLLTAEENGGLALTVTAPLVR